ncbi:hypothetical protein [uncultured Abiotrophia sp.]|uniref:hypothetical protein n=1 Tax=uncultured Abiotrophia sp. TaxID=316094 RepID=UPI0028D8C5C7|nr:hypothetical protein [uncultured Abiotrophia sp.]
MPVWLIPLAIKGAAAVAGLVGVGSAVQGASKMKEANDHLKEAQSRYESNTKKFEQKNKYATLTMDKLGKLELEILASFDDFSDTFEQIQNRPKFEKYSKDKVTIPEYNGEDIKEVSVGAGVLLGGLGGAGLGAAGGFAAAGATTAAVMAVGTASTGTAIASLTGVAATNATLAALGGGAIAAGGGGIAAGTAVLGAATLGVGLLIGGAIFNFTGSKLSDKADEAMKQVEEAEKQINIICEYLDDLGSTAHDYYLKLAKVSELYYEHLNGLKTVVNMLGHRDWNTFSREEKVLTENTVLLVGLLYSMCKVKLVLQAENDGELNTINKEAVCASIKNAEIVLEDKFSK